MQECKFKIGPLPLPRRPGLWCDALYGRGAVRFLHCCLWTFALAALVVGTAPLPTRAEEPEESPVEEPPGDDEPPLPTIDRMELPSFQRLMKGPAIDWIVMH